MKLRHGNDRGKGRMRVALAVGIFAALTASTAQKRTDTSAKAKPSAGMFLVQAGDKFDVNAGTLAVRFLLNYSLDSYLMPELSEYATFPFLQVGGGQNHLSVDQDVAYMAVTIRQERGKNFFQLTANTHHTVRRIGTNDVFRRAALSVNLSRENGPWLERGEPHDLVVTWKILDDDLHLDMYLDGKPVGSRVYKERKAGISAFTNDGFLSIGSTQISAATLLSYRLSKRALTREEVAAKAPLDDAYLFNETTLGKVKKVSLPEFRAMDKSGKLDYKRGVFIGDYQIIQTSEGKGVQFSK